MDKHSFKTKLRKGDQVVIIAGRSKGQKGAIDRIDAKNGKVYVAGCNLVKKAQKPNELNPQGGLIEKPAGVHISNVAFIDAKTKKATRLGYRVTEGNKTRFAKKSGQSL